MKNGKTTRALLLSLALVAVFFAVQQSGITSGGNGTALDTRMDSFCRTLSSRAAPPADSAVIVTVNDSVIRYGTYRSAVDDRLFYDTTGVDTLQVHREILGNLINVELLYQEAGKKGVNLKKEAGKLRAYTIRRGFTSDSAYSVRLKKTGMTQQEYEHQWYRSAVVNVYVETQIAPKEEVEEKTLRTLYRRLKKQAPDSAAVRSFEEIKSHLQEMYRKEKTKVLVDKKVAQLRDAATFTFAGMPQ